MNNVIQLERVAFRDPVDVPGPSAKDGESPQYPTQEKIVGCYPKPKGLMAKQQFNLWFDPALNGVVIEHPESKEQEFIPFANIKQWRVKRDPAKAKTGAPRSQAA